MKFTEIKGEAEASSSSMSSGTEKTKISLLERALIPLGCYRQIHVGDNESHTKGFGTIVSSDGLFMVNADVLYDLVPTPNSNIFTLSDEITGKVVVFSGEPINATVVHVDTSLNVAFLKIQSSHQWPTAALGSSSCLEPGQDLLYMSLCVLTGQCQTQTCTLRQGECPHIFHTDLKSRERPGVFVRDGKVVGLDIDRCPYGDNVVHFLGIDSIREALVCAKKKSLSIESGDAKKKSSNIQFRDASGVHVSPQEELEAYKQREIDSLTELKALKEYMMKMAADAECMRVLMQNMIPAERQHRPKSKLKKRKAPISA